MNRLTFGSHARAIRRANLRATRSGGQESGEEAPKGEPARKLEVDVIYPSFT